MSEFLDAYIECALWSSTNMDTEKPLDDDYGVGDIADEALTRMAIECEDFQQLAEPVLAEAYQQPGYGPAQAGHDFWLTRNRHGAGFWDRGLGETGEKLTQMAKWAGPVDLYVGDDGKVYQ